MIQYKELELRPRISLNGAVWLLFNSFELPFFFPCYLLCRLKDTTLPASTFEKANPLFYINFPFGASHFYKLQANFFAWHRHKFIASSFLVLSLLCYRNSCLFQWPPPTTLHNFLSRITLLQMFDTKTFLSCWLNYLDIFSYTFFPFCFKCEFQIHFAPFCETKIKFC